MYEGKILHLLYNPIAAVLVFGGTIGAAMISHPWKVIRQTHHALRLMVFPPKIESPIEIINTIVSITEKAKRNGIESLQNDVHTIENKFLANAIHMMIGGYEKELIEENLDREITYLRIRHQKLGGLFRTMATMAPIFGLLGTLVGVVQVLKNIQDPKAMGASMAIAVTTTFYGIFGANFLFLPVTIKLNEYSQDEVLNKELITEGVMSIMEGDVPTVVSKKLETFLSMRLREAELQKK